MVAGGSFATILAGLFADAMGWIRFRGKDRADVKKTEAETAVALAKAKSQKIQDEKNIAEITKEWAVELKKQANEEYSRRIKLQNDLDRLQRELYTVRNELEVLRKENAELIEEKADLIKRLNDYINAGNAK